VLAGVCDDSIAYLQANLWVPTGCQEGDIPISDERDSSRLYCASKPLTAIFQLIPQALSVALHGMSDEKSRRPSPGLRQPAQASL
jgi:hypothetical protein